MPDELVMRLGHRRVVDALVLSGGLGKAHLLSEDRLSGARRTSQDHDRSRLQATIEHQIEPRNVSSHVHQCPLRPFSSKACAILTRWRSSYGLFSTASAAPAR